MKSAHGQGADRSSSGSRFFSSTFQVQVLGRPATWGLVARSDKSTIPALQYWTIVVWFQFPRFTLSNYTVYILHTSSQQTWPNPCSNPNFLVAVFVSRYRLLKQMLPIYGFEILLKSGLFTWLQPPNSVLCPHTHTTDTFWTNPQDKLPMIPGLNPQMPILWLVQFPFDVSKIPNYCWSTSPYIVFNTPSEAKVRYYFGCHVLIDRVNPPLLIAIFYYIVII